MSETITTLQARAMELVDQHGGVRPASRVLMCDAGYLSRLVRGEKTEPGDALLKRMGLRRKVSYVVAAPPQPVSAEAGKGVPAWYAVETPGGEFDISFVTTLEEARELVEQELQEGAAESELITPLYSRPSESVAVSGEVSDAQILTLARQWRDWTSANIKPLKFSEPNVLSFARAVLALAGSGGKEA